jgi:hypothetical protein
LRKIASAASTTLAVFAGPLLLKFLSCDLDPALGIFQTIDDVMGVLVLMTLIGLEASEAHQIRMPDLFNGHALAAGEFGADLLDS